MKRIIWLVVCLTIGGVIAVVFINPYIEATQTQIYTVDTQNNWWYVGSQLLLLLAFVIIGFLWGVKNGRKPTESNPYFN
jgi:uncharacterized protein YneF (UPF0154 family)